MGEFGFDDVRTPFFNTGGVIMQLPEDEIAKMREALVSVLSDRFPNEIAEFGDLGGVVGEYFNIALYGGMDALDLIRELHEYLERSVNGM